MSKDNHGEEKIPKDERDDDMLTISKSPNRVNMIKKEKSKEFLELLGLRSEENKKLKAKFKRISGHIDK